MWYLYPPPSVLILVKPEQKQRMSNLPARGAPGRQKTTYKASSFQDCRHYSRHKGGTIERAYQNKVRDGRGLDVPLMVNPMVNGTDSLTHFFGDGYKSVDHQCLVRNHIYQGTVGESLASQAGMQVKKRTLGCIQLCILEERGSTGMQGLHRRTSIFAVAITLKYRGSPAPLVFRAKEALYTSTQT